VRYFAGLDMSLEETAICIVDEAGGIVREARVASEPDALVAFFDALGMTMERVGLEACSLTAWLHQGLSEAGIPAVCIEARQAKAAMGAMPNKTAQRHAHRADAAALRHISRVLFSCIICTTKGMTPSSGLYGAADSSAQRATSATVGPAEP
jgi:transposase